MKKIKSKVSIGYLPVLLIINLLFFSACSKQNDDVLQKEELLQSTSSLKTTTSFGFTYPFTDYPSTTDSYMDLYLTTYSEFRSGRDAIKAIFKLDNEKASFEDSNQENVIILPFTVQSISFDVYDNSIENIGADIEIYGKARGSLRMFSSKTIDDSGWENYRFIARSGHSIKYIALKYKYDGTPNSVYWRNLKIGDESYTVSEPECNIPTVTVFSTKSEIWSPKNKMVNVEFYGSITNDCSTGGTYKLTDEYGQVEYDNGVISSNGDFNVDIDLPASRKGNDKDGRKYTFTVSSTNDEGTTDASIDVIVKHDNRKIK